MFHSKFDTKGGMQALTNVFVAIAVSLFFLTGNWKIYLNSRASLIFQSAKNSTLKQGSQCKGAVSCMGFCCCCWLFFLPFPKD